MLGLAMIVEAQKKVSKLLYSTSTLNDKVALLLKDGVILT